MEIVRRRIIVKMARPEGEATMSACVDSVLSRAEGCQLLRPPGKSGRMVLTVPDGESETAFAKKVGGAKEVIYAEPDLVDRAQIVPSDPRYPDQWAPPIVNAEAAWDLETGQNNVLIGIIDSGISMTGATLDHDDLSDTGRITLGTDSRHTRP